MKDVQGPGPWFAAAVLPFLALCTLNSAGYRYGASDLAFYAPAVLLRLRPSSFPADAYLINSQGRLTGADETLALVARLTGASLPTLFAGAYIFTLVLLAYAAWSIAGSIYRTRWTALALLAAVTLRHAVSRSGTNTLEGYFHPRQLAFGFGAMAIAGLLRGSLPVSVACLGLAALVHPTTALWFAIWTMVAAAVTDRRLRLPLIAVSALGGLAALWLCTAGPLGGRLVRIDPEWLATLDSKDYLFPLAWPLWVWTFNLVYLPVIVLIYRRRSARGLLVRGETGIVMGCLSLLLIFAAVLPFNAAKVAIAVQIQSPRIFWMLDFLAVIYTVWALAEWRADAGARPSGPLLRRARTVAVIVALASVARSAYVMLIRFADRPAVQFDIPDTDWGRAMRWARSTNATSGWLADPMHAILYGTSVRVAGERDVFVEAVKDAAIGMYDRRVAIRTRDRIAELRDFSSLTPERCRDLAGRYGLDYLITDKALDLPMAFQSGALRVYTLR